MLFTPVEIRVYSGGKKAQKINEFLLGTKIEKGSDFWALKFGRELDDLILMLRTNELEIGVITIRSKGLISPIQDISNKLAESQENYNQNRKVSI